jgi:hypothetical protein
MNMRGTLAACVMAALLSTSACTSATGTAQPIPRIEHTDGKYRLMVDDSPFLILGGQIHNSSTGNPEDLAKAMDVLAGMHANVVEVPIYWESVESEPGKYDFSTVDTTLREARKRNLHVVFLWFGTWKNGESHYTPEWVKRDRQRFQRVIGSHGEETAVLSPIGEASRTADATAFAALMGHIKTADQATRSVLMVQVENEPGLIGTDRDYSPAATHLYDGAVPAQLVDYLRQHQGTLTTSMKAALKLPDASSTGTWSQVFGNLAPEAFSAWYVASYTDAVAKAGKQAYALPMYSNVWQIEGVERGGRWPSGGATEHVLDIWKAAAPSIDILAPDIYYPKFYDVSAVYHRADNPLWVPEVNFNPYFVGFVYTVLGDFNGIGFSPFGIDDVAKGGDAAAIGMMFADTYGTLGPLLPIIAQYQNTGHIHTVIQGTGNGEDWNYSIPVGGRLAAVVEFTVPYTPDKGRASGMIIELGPRDFLVVGHGFKVTFRELDGPLRDAELLSIEQGTFEGKQWVPARRLNGDERHVELPEASTVLRVRVNQP